MFAQLIASCALLACSAGVSGLALADQPPATPSSQPPVTPSAPAAPATLAPAVAPPEQLPQQRPRPLSVGDPAPALTISNWIRGEPVSQLSRGQVYLVEFWATWCPPCRRSFDALSKLQSSHDASKLVVIGVAGVDSHGETPERIEAFLQARGDKVHHRIALDNESTTRADWLGAARIMQIPAAFVVSQDGRLAWIGNPATAAPAMQRAVDELLVGTFNFDKAILAAKVDLARRAEVEERAAELQVKLRQAMEEDDQEMVAVTIDALIRLDPDRYSRLGVARFQALLAGDAKSEAALDYARALLSDRLRDDPLGLQSLAWAILEAVPTGAGRDLALLIATRASELVDGDDAVILDTLARAQFELGQIDAAIGNQRKAVEKAPSGKIKEELTQTLAKYQAAKKR